MNKLLQSDSTKKLKKPKKKTCTCTNYLHEKFFEGVFKFKMSNNNSTDNSSTLHQFGSIYSMHPLQKLCQQQLHGTSNQFYDSP